jgi:hypothetical protein
VAAEKVAARRKRAADVVLFGPRLGRYTMARMPARDGMRSYDPGVDDDAPLENASSIDAPQYVTWLAHATIRDSPSLGPIV